MSYVLSKSTADWIRREKARNESLDKSRRGWIFNDQQEERVCVITGGNPQTGYTCVAYMSVADALQNVNGISEIDGEPIKIFPLEIGLTAEIPEETMVLCHWVVCRGMAEDAPQEEDGSVSEEEQDEQQGS